ncbi:MAG: PDZ domain-containing protein, partial [Candidatus Acidiferrales bacterium]
MPERLTMSEDKSQQRRQWEFKLQSLAVVLFLVTLATVIFAGINFQQRARYVRPYDGIDWELDREKGVFARIVWQDTPGDLAGIRPGDTLLRINGQSVRKETDVTKQLFRAQPGTQLTYELRRYGKTVTTTVVAIPQSDPFSLRGFLEFVGVLYLGIGLFVLLKRWEAPHALHFYLFCLISFIVYSFSYSGKLNNFDWIIYWADLVALVLQPALFLHFALSFPKPHSWFRPRRWAFALLYAPAALLLAVRARLVPLSLEEGELVRVELAHLVVLFLLAAAVFEYTYRTTREPILTQQMKWVTRGTWLAILPFALFYAMPFALYYAPTDWMKLSTLSLVFIPLTFGYAIIRYRLMDVDVIFRRGVAYTLATAAIAGIYFGLAVALAQLFNTNVGFGTSGVVVAIIIAAVLFQPIKDWTQVQLDRLFYRERFDYRRTLEEFARELSGEINLVRLLARLLDRLSRTLPVDRMAIFLEEEEAPGYFRLARGEGLPPADLRLN